MESSSLIKMYDPSRDYKKHRPEYDATMMQIAKSGKFINGPQVIELEKNLTEYVGRECITVSSGTDALLIALLALNIKPDDEIITTPFTWISSVEVIMLIGAKPVFVDIDKNTFNIDPTLIEAKLTTKTKAMIIVDLFGQMADYSIINKIANKYHIPVIQDFAQAFGAEQDDIKAGNQGLISCTSFFPSKPLGCYGDGGACFTDDKRLAEIMRNIRNHGSVVKNLHTRLGINGRLDTLQAGILLVKLKYFEESRKQRRIIAKIYEKKLNYQYWLESTPIKLPKTLKNNVHVYATYTIRVNDRDGLLKFMKENEVELSVFYPRCLHEQPVFFQFGYRKGDFPVAEKVANEVISLPCYPELEEWEQRTIISLIKSYLKLV